MVHEQIEDEDGWNTVPVRRSKSASRGRSSRRRDGRSYENVVRGNRIWVSKADLVSRWGHRTEGGSGSGTARGKCVMFEKSMDSELKGKGVKEFTDLEINEVFMETEDEEFEQVQAGGNRKRVRSEGKSGE